MKRNWVVWSYEHSAWWAANHSGYMAELLHAGLYTEAEAKEIELRANGDRLRKSEAAMSVTQAFADARTKWGGSGPMVLNLVEAAFMVAETTDREVAGK